MFDDADLRAAAAAGHDAPVEALDPVEAGSNHTYRVAYADGDRGFLKVGTVSPEAAGMEPETTRAVGRQTPVPVPAVRATGTDPLDYPFAVYEFVPGAGYERMGAVPPGVARRLCHEAGENLRAVHRVGFEEFGRVGVPDGDDGPELAVLDAHDYRDWLRRALDRQVESLGDTRFADLAGEVERVGHGAIDAADLDRVDPTLVHGDYRLGNLRVDPDTVGNADPGGSEVEPAAAGPGADRRRVTAAVLDWEFPTAGDPLRDVAVSLSLLTTGYGLAPGRRRSLRAAFREGYGPVPDGGGRWHLHELLARVRMARHLDAEVARLPGSPVEDRAAEHRRALGTLLDGGTRLER